MPQQKALTRLETAVAKKQELAETEEYYRQVDAPTGAEFVKHTLDLEQAQDKKIADDIKTDLENKKQQLFSYRRMMAEYAKTQLEKLDWPKNWEYEVLPTDGSPINLYHRWFKTQEGVVTVLKSPAGKVFARAVLSSYDPIYDVPAMDTVVVQVENTVDGERGLLLSDKPPKTKGGIYMP